MGISRVLEFFSRIGWGSISDRSLPCHCRHPLRYSRWWPSCVLHIMCYYYFHCLHVDPKISPSVEFLLMSANIQDIFDPSIHHHHHLLNHEYKEVRRLGRSVEISTRHNDCGVLTLVRHRTCSKAREMSSNPSGTRKIWTTH